MRRLPPHMDLCRRVPSSSLKHKFRAHSWSDVGPHRPKCWPDVGRWVGPDIGAGVGPEDARGQGGHRCETGSPDADLAKIGPGMARQDRPRRTRPISGDFVPDVPNFGTHSTNIGQLGQKSAKFWPIVAEDGPISNNFEQIMTGIDQLLPQPEQIRPNFARSRPKVPRNRPTHWRGLCQIWLSFTPKPPRSRSVLISRLSYRRVRTPFG